MPRGAWKTPALYAAEHCQECAGLAKTLAVPALEEEPLFFSNENCYEQRLPEFIALTRSLLDNGSGLAQTRLVLNRRVRATIVNAFAETVAADPLPVFINTLSVGTRSVPTDITQPRLQAALADLPWAQLLARSMPRVLTDKCAPHLLQEALGEAVPIIIRSQVHCG
jgi:hypothetical protein